MEIEQLVVEQRKFFATGKTLSYDFRIDALTKLKEGIETMKDEILNALKADLGKSAFEGYMTEVGMALDELHFVKKNLKKWMKKERVKTSLANFRARSYRIPSPLGNVLIMSPWNYPFLLTIDPLIDALAAGNTAILKPGSYSANVSLVIKKLVESIFPPEYVAVVLGGRAENQKLLDQKFDYIFFTGSKDVGHLVQEKASVYLTPITLELGGKSPCIVDETANLKVAATRIVFGKFLNCGQTCVAPDYLLVHKSVKEELVGYLKKEVVKQFGEKPLDNPNFGKIINHKHFERLLGLIKDEKIIIGGENNPSADRIAPTILDNITLASPVMGEEIFGPILPILTYEKDQDIETIISANPTPLAFYLFTTRKDFADYLTHKVSFGGGCINDTIVHLASSHMPFGGVGTSGMGGYHGKFGFDTFSHYKSILNKAYSPDLTLRYQPYNKNKFKLIKMFLK